MLGPHGASPAGEDGAAGLAWNPTRTVNFSPRPPIFRFEDGRLRGLGTHPWATGPRFAFIGHRFDLRRGMTGIGSHLRHMSRTLQFDLPRHPTRAFVCVRPQCKAARSNLITARLPRVGLGGQAMAMRIVAIAFAIAGAACWLWPGAFVGWLFPALPVSVREAWLPARCSSLAARSYGSYDRRIVSSNRARNRLTATPST
jgi:hypothetical protein